MSTVENQKIVRINTKSPADENHLYIKLNKECMFEAMKELKYVEFKTFMYLASNQENYEFALSTKDIADRIGANKRNVQDSINSLIEKNYINHIAGNRYTFDENALDENRGMSKLHTGCEQNTHRGMSKLHTGYEQITHRNTTDTTEYNKETTEKFSAYAVSVKKKNLKVQKEIEISDFLVDKSKTDKQDFYNNCAYLDIPTFVKDMTYDEKLQLKDMFENPIDTRETSHEEDNAILYSDMYSFHEDGATVEQIASHVGKSTKFVQDFIDYTFGKDEVGEPNNSIDKKEVKPFTTDNYMEVTCGTHGRERALHSERIDNFEMIDYYADGTCEISMLPFN